MLMFSSSFCSLIHLTMIAWERYIAIRRWADYKTIVTRSRLKKMAIGAWVTAVVAQCFQYVIREIMTAAVGEDTTTLALANTILSIGWGVLIACILVLIVFFYIMIYLGVRKRKLNQIHQVKALIQAKLENRVPMTTAVVTIALILSFVPAVIVIILEEVYPVLHTRFAWKLSDSLLFLNSLVNPLIYCYRDHRFRNAVLEMLRIRKPTTVSATEAVKFVKRKNSLDPGNVSLQKKEENPVRLARSASCDLVPFSFNQTFNKSRNASLKRTMSAPSVPKDYNSANVKIQKVENWPICLPRSASCD